MARDFDVKALKDDAFRDTLFLLIDWVYHWRRSFIAAGVAVLLAAIAGGGYYTYRQSAIEKQSARFLEAERAGAKADVPEAERAPRVRKAFEAFATEFPGSALAPVAWMHVARLAWKAGDAEAARKAFEQARSHGQAPPPLRDLAQIGLAKLDEAQGKLDQAAAGYQAVSAGDYEVLKALNLGRIAALQHRDEEARQLFEKAARSPGDSALADWARQHLDYHP